jgi:uroporphyrinogen decarboxylase
VWDIDLLQSAGGLWCNILHMHGEQIYFDAVADYPAQIINWHDREAGPSLSNGLQVWPGVVCGGLGRDTLVYQSADHVTAEAREAIAASRGQRLLLSTGCVIPIITPYGNIAAARRAVHREGTGQDG